ncbi:subtilase family protein [Haloactinopolyspora alba]|uniref:Subtilase family protein n=1 Tax=Haloactinopolyspora alba TaxID=648780 RepID=A0A2P8DM04_9ACTN|nr:S8/S53 family peptidase [Haloactinopolyspora alba]PSK98260.1 subtilase family protein [Haloactinopolyspora alba]
MPVGPDGHDATTLASEVERLQRNARARSQNRAFPLGAKWDSTERHVEYLYRDDQLICEGRDLNAALEAFDLAGEARPDDVSDGPLGLKVLHVGERDAARIADSLADIVGEDTVTPNHVLDSQGYTRMCPATEPLPHSGPVPQLAEPHGPGHARLAVVDTGYSSEVARDSAYGRLLAVEDTSEIDDEIYGSDGQILPYGGHGTATTARLLSVSGIESTSVQVRDCLVGGAVDELTIVEDLATVIRDGADIVTLQAGLFTRAGRAPKSFDALRRKILRDHPTTVIVAAAGNNGTERPFWPAAYDWTTAVGALTYGGDARAPWSSVGHWVNVYASGENVVVPFLNGYYEYLDGFSAEFTGGHAVWSGTSFAAPVVAGMIARRMIERGVDAPTARDIVLREAAVAALPATGPRVLSV